MTEELLECLRVVNKTSLNQAFERDGYLLVKMAGPLNYVP